MENTLPLALLGVSLLAAAPVNAQDGVEVGMLDCVIDGGTGFIVGSTKDISCIFKPASNEFEPESYFGVVRKFGIDIGTTGPTMMQWAVVTPVANKYVAGALAGDYVGASAGVTVGVGAGANFLVGGSNRAFTLQPVSVEAQTGLNLAVGVSEFQLRSMN
jgi:hypothetical protein